MSLDVCGDIVYKLAKVFVFFQGVGLCNIDPKKKGRLVPSSSCIVLGLMMMMGFNLFVIVSSSHGSH